MTDQELQALMDSDLDAGAKALYRQYAQYMYAIIFRILRDCGSREDVEDCFAETFAEIIQHRDGIHAETMKAYIGQAARNRALNYAASLGRQRKHTIPIDSIHEPVTEHMQEELEQKAAQQALLQKIKELGEPDATILVQKYYFGRTMREIGKMVGMQPHAAQVRCGRALKKLRKEMEEWR